MKDKKKTRKASFVYPVMGDLGWFYPGVQKSTLACAGIHCKASLVCTIHVLPFDRRDTIANNRLSLNIQGGRVQSVLQSFSEFSKCQSAKKAFAFAHHTTAARPDLRENASSHVCRAKDFGQFIYPVVRLG